MIEVNDGITQYHKRTYYTIVHHWRIVSESNRNQAVKFK